MAESLAYADMAQIVLEGSPMRCLNCDSEVKEGFPVNLCRACGFVWEPERTEGNILYPLSWSLRRMGIGAGFAPRGCLAIFGERME